MRPDGPTIESLRGKTTVPLWPDAGRACGLGRNSTYAAAAAGEIPTLRFGKKTVVPVPKLLALLGVDDPASVA